jgi:hypothetical protein
MSHQTRSSFDRKLDADHARSRYRLSFDFSCSVFLGLNEILTEGTITLERIGDREPDVTDFDLRFAHLQLLVRHPERGLTVVRVPIDLEALKLDDSETYGLIAAETMQDGTRKATKSERWSFVDLIEKEDL